jgi:hypothetical protein
MEGEMRNDMGETPESGASLRVMGIGLDLEQISRNLSLKPSHVHKAGDPGPLRQPYTQDMWALQSPLDLREPLDAHLKWLRAALLPHYEFLSSLRKKADVDIYCSFGCFSDQNGLKLSTEALRLFQELGVPLDVSITVVLSNE